MTKNDPVVRRIRETRRKIASQAGYDRRKLLEWAKRIEAQHPERVVGYQRGGATGGADTDRS